MQVSSYFQWVNYATEAAPTFRAPLFINLDETAVGYSFTGQQGTILCTKKLPPGEKIPSENVSLADRRGHVTHICMITHDSEMQARLPQIILGNEHKFTYELLRSVSNERPRNVELWRQASSWNNHCTMRRVLRSLAASLGTALQDFYVILVLDVAPCHIHPSIYQEARRLGIRLVYVPAGLTSVLQPLDTHVFARYKAALQRAWRKVKSTKPDGVVTPRDWLLMIFEATRVLRQIPWKSAFMDTGILAGQSHLSADVLKAAGWETLPAIEAASPSAEDAACIFPRKRKLDIGSYVTWPPLSPAAAAAPKRRVLPESFGVAAPKAGAVRSRRAGSSGMVLRPRPRASVILD